MQKKQKWQPPPPWSGCIQNCRLQPRPVRTSKPWPAGQFTYIALHALHYTKLHRITLHYMHYIALRYMFTLPANRSSGSHVGMFR